MYAPWTSRPKPWFDSCSITTCCKSPESLHRSLSKMAGVWNAMYRICLFMLNFSKVRSTLNRHSHLPSAQLHLSTPVHAAWSGKGNVILETAAGRRETFDDALGILDAGSGATHAQRVNLSAFRWNRNEVRLHFCGNVPTWVLSSCLEGKMRNGC
jgi:hypothetical protein